MVRSQLLFQVKWFFSYGLPSSAYSTTAKIICDPRHEAQAVQRKKLTSRARTIVDLFRSLTENEWIFSTDSMDQLEKLQTPDWWVNAGEVDWELYFINLCIGLKKHALKEPVVDVGSKDVAHV